MKILNSTIYNSESDAIPLVILHGLFGMTDNWNSLAKKFAKTRPVYVLDLRNHGRSFHSDEMNLEVMAADLNRYLEYHDINNTFLLGHSLGGKVILSFLMKHPEKVVKAIIVDIGLKKYPPHHQNIIKALKSIDFKIDNSRKKIDESLSKLIPQIEIRQFLLKNVGRNENNEYQFTNNLDGIEKNYISLLKEIVPTEIIEVPILFIKGGNSEYIEVQEILTAKNYFPNLEVKTISNAGHWVHAEKPNEFYEIVENYLDE